MSTFESRWSPQSRSYLGISFTPEGWSTANLKAKLVSLLDRLTKAPLKPQQRLFDLKVFLLLKVFHHMVLGRITISSLHEMDKTVRGLVKQRLALPNNTSIAYFNARVAEGGLNNGHSIS